MNAVTIRFGYVPAEHNAFVQGQVKPFVEGLERRHAGARVLLRKSWTDDASLAVVVDGLDPAAIAAVGEHAEAMILDAVAMTGPDRSAPGDAPASRFSGYPRSVTISAYAPVPPFGLAELGRAKDRFHRAMLDDVFVLNDRLSTSRGAAMAGAVQMLANVCAAGGPGYAFWPLSMFIHSELFLRRNPTSRTAFDEAFRRIQSQRATVDRAAGGGFSVPRQSVAGEAKAEQAIAALTAEASDVILTDPSADAGWSLDGDSSMMNRFGGFFGIPGEELATLFRHPDHRRYRAVVNFVFDLFPVIGMSAGERCLACYLMWRMFAEATPDPESKLRQVVADMANAVPVAVR